MEITQKRIAEVGSCFVMKKMAFHAQTTVSISRSQEKIRKLLMDFGVSGVQFSEDFELSKINVRFAKTIGGNLRTVSWTVNVPKPTVAKIASLRKDTKDQQKRKEKATQIAYRALHDILKAQFVAVSFGASTFEELFLSHFEWLLPDGSVTTIGSVIIPRLESRPEFLLEQGVG
jgi:hypothetical protein